MPIDRKHPDVTSADPSWKRCRDVLGGSDAVKQGGRAYLPQLSAQRQRDYASYLCRALFYNGTARTRAALVGSVFSKDLEAKIPDAIRARTRALVEDFDLCGAPL